MSWVVVMGRPVDVYDGMVHALLLYSMGGGAEADREKREVNCSPDPLPDQLDRPTWIIGGR